MEMIQDMERLERALSHIGKANLATKQPDRTLRHAVGGLMLELEIMTGRRATASYRQSAKNKPAKPNSPEGRAIASLLRVAQPDLMDTTIANEISRDFKGRHLTEFVGQLLLGAPAYAAP